jgi:FixJ family two-component response regulator
MGGMNGLDLQRHLRERGCRLPVIVITAYAQVPLAVQAMETGAVTFLEKSCSEHDLWSAISRALATERDSWAIDSRRREIEERLTRLSAEERAVLDALLLGRSNKQIAFAQGIALRTVEKRRAAVMRKMEADSLAQLVLQATTAGISGRVERVCQVALLLSWRHR